MSHLRFWTLFVLIIFVGYFAVQLKIYPQLKFNSITDRIQHPFDSRVRYRIGEIDPRFNLSKSELITLAQQAADIWHLGTHQQYFIYDPNAKLSINLVYDERQSESEARRNELEQIEHSKQSIKEERAKLDELRDQLDYYHQEIERLRVNYTTKVDTYNQWINSLNQHNRAYNQNTMNQIEYEKEQLRSEQAQIQAQIDFFNERVAQLNQQVDMINSMKNEINHAVDRFNTQFQPRQFDKGIFNGREINIYEFNSINDLKLTLAHELGHALGMLHTDDPYSLMYPMMEKQNIDDFSLRPADLQLLNSRR